jgi:sulfoxide reductase catalytic subunit YedY
MYLRIRKDWELRGLRETPEAVYLGRRRFLQALGIGGLSCLGAPAWPRPGEDEELTEKPAGAGSAAAPKLYPAKRNPKYTLGRRLTPPKFVTTYNNFYEFSFEKGPPALLAQRMVTSPWEIEVAGLVKKELRFDLDDLLRKLPLEERLYRFRCVEAWAMAVPWTGIPMKKFLDLVEPLGSAKFVRFVTFLKPEWGPGFADTEYPWPYHEALAIEEAANELTLLVTGLYGKPLPKQNGAPIRLIVPWKYGFKSIKSIVRVELVEQQPATFWNTVLPDEYDFRANVNPKVPHPRWSQAQERLIDTGEIVPTKLYNGYEAQVAGLYKG